MRKGEKVVFYILFGVLFLLLILNIFYTATLHNITSGSDGASNNANQAAIEISDDTTKVVKSVNDSVVTVALYQGDRLIGNGSGSIYNYANNKAKIITNNHVVDSDGDISIKVIFSNKKEVDATIIGKDAVSDLALLETKVDFKPTPIKLGDSSKLQVGESVIAIGSPLDIQFTGTVTKGIISGLNRMIDSNNTTMEFIQTDTSINPGNSGGPLINMAGQMIGINTSKISMTGYEGMGFSIPINEALSIIEKLEKDGKIERPVLGISYQPVSTLLEYSQGQVDIPKGLDEGLYVVSVNAGSAAAKAGIKADDIIYSVNDKEITKTSVFSSVLYASKKGDVLKLGIYRNGEKITINVTL